MPIKFYDEDVLRSYVFSTDFNIDFHTRTINIFNSDSMVYEDVLCTKIKVFDTYVEAYL